MRNELWALFAPSILMTTPALAAPCKTVGTVDAPIAFPKNDASDVGVARSMVPAMFMVAESGAPSAPSCTRVTVSTAQGDYVIGGENDDDFARMALRADGKAGAVVYLAESPDAPGKYALIVRLPNAPIVTKVFYGGIPTDERLIEDIRAALAGDAGIMSFDSKKKTVSYGFVPVGGVPPPVATGSSAGGVTIDAGPQVLIADSGDPATLDMNDDMRHKPSGFACPQRFDGLAVLLMWIEPKNDSLVCNYRAGTDLRFKADDPVRYQLILLKARPGQSARDVFDQLVKDGRKVLKIKGDHTPPWAIGPAAAPEMVAFWDTDGEGIQGVWLVEAGNWIVYLRAQYEPGAANDVEAGTVAQTLFALIKRQVK